MSDTITLKLGPDEFRAVRRFAAWDDPDDALFSLPPDAPNASGLGESLREFMRQWRTDRPWTRLDEAVRPGAPGELMTRYTLDVPKRLAETVLVQMRYWGNEGLFGREGLHGECHVVACQLEELLGPEADVNADNESGG